MCRLTIHRWIDTTDDQISEIMSIFPLRIMGPRTPTASSLTPTPYFQPSQCLSKMVLSMLRHDVPPIDGDEDILYDDLVMRGLPYTQADSDASEKGS